MKFTFPILTLCKGGAQRMLAEVTNGLVDKGHEVIILMPPQGDVEFNIKAKLVRTKSSMISESDYPVSDVIVSNYYSTVPQAQQASINGKGVHVRFSLCYEPAFLPDNHITFPTYHVTPRMIVLSKWHHDLIKLNHGISGEIVPVGVSSSFKNLNIRKPDDRLEVSAVIRKAEGGFSWHREQAYLIQQLEMVKNRYNHIQINLFCPPAELASSSDLQKLKKNGKFRFYTPADDTELCYHYNQSDIFVNSSTYDTASLPGLESMRCGAALATTYAGGNADYCKHEQNCLISYRYENKLSEDILRLIHNPKLREKLAKQGEQDAAAWTWTRSVNLFEQAITKLVTIKN